MLCLSPRGLETARLCGVWASPWTFSLRFSPKAHILQSYLFFLSQSLQFFNLRLHLAFAWNGIRL